MTKSALSKDDRKLVKAAEGQLGCVAEMLTLLDEAHQVTPRPEYRALMLQGKTLAEQLTACVQACVLPTCALHDVHRLTAINAEIADWINQIGVYANDRTGVYAKDWDC